MNSNITKTSNPNKLLRNLTGKRNLKRSDKYVALIDFSIYYTWKEQKDCMKIIDLKYQQLLRRMINLSCLADHISYQIFRIILDIL